MSDTSGVIRQGKKRRRCTGASSFDVYDITCITHSLSRAQSPLDIAPHTGCWTQFLSRQQEVVPAITRTTSSRQSNSKAKESKRVRSAISQAISHDPISRAWLPQREPGGIYFFERAAEITRPGDIGLGCLLHALPVATSPAGMVCTIDQKRYVGMCRETGAARTPGRFRHPCTTPIKE
jgi:hypothetical protein